MSSSLKIAIFQGESKQGDIQYNLNVVEQFAEKASKSDVDILIFPECFLTGYYQQEGIKHLASLVDRQLISKLEKISDKCNLAMVIGYYEVCNDKIYNSAIFIAPDEIDHPIYRKRQLYGDWEKQNFIKGDADVIFKYKGFELSILICFDIEFPEHARRLAHKNVDALLIPTSLMAPYDHVAQILVPARAIENQIFIAYANRIKYEDELEYVGQSCIIAPDGKALCRANYKDETLLIASIDKNSIKNSRSELNYLAESPRNEFN